ncbi:MAG: DUF1818 family protein [Pseudanabaenaceae cyanobacterium SKYGB_i_bin29]|nr:DUF1818 family protein [Pseudanabaenaceae cyanobacterium SKYG29]MDW8422068.1 DUF1818 family protein [Pseudanabaenaceae cyanobacterium SKYGB_i_bin29]
MIEVGRGWRYGYREGGIYVGLLGGEDWAFEVTEAEWQEFWQLFSRLVDTIACLAGELVDQETFRCEVEGELWELEAEGLPQSWRLRLQTRSGRRAEGFWSHQAVAEVWAKRQLPPGPALGA